MNMMMMKTMMMMMKTMMMMMMMMMMWGESKLLFVETLHYYQYRIAKTKN
jgi:hypothetical protein